MPANKNALIRYKTIDNCLRNHHRQWTLDDLVDACSDALYELEGIDKGVSVRTVQGDLRMMRSEQLYGAPIEVYDNKYYRYADKDFSITKLPLSQNDYEVLQEAIDMLRQLEDFSQFQEMSDVMGRLQDKLSIGKHNRKPVIQFDKVPDLKGLRLLNPLYNYIVNQQTLKITYQSFTSTSQSEFILSPYLLKEFRNRWFIFGSRAGSPKVYGLPLDRIVNVEPSDTPFYENPKFDSEHFFDDVIGVSKNVGSQAQKVRFWASAEQSKYIITKPIHPSQQITESREDGSNVFIIRVVVNFEMFSVLMSYGNGLKVLSPRNVKKYMAEQTRAMAKLYEENTRDNPEEKTRK